LLGDLEAEVQGKRLLKYFEHDELAKIPSIGVHNKEDVEEAEHHTALELIRWLGEITPDKILEDIKQMLGHHYDKAATSTNLEHSYNHKSEYVHISSHKSDSSDNPPRIFLTPSRHRSAIRDRYKGIRYPMYYVFKS